MRVIGRFTLMQCRLLLQLSVGGNKKNHENLDVSVEIRTRNSPYQMKSFTVSASSFVT